MPRPDPVMLALMHGLVWVVVCAVAIHIAIASAGVID